MRREYRWLALALIGAYFLDPSHALGAYFNLDTFSKSQDLPIVIESTSAHMNQNTGVISARKGMQLWHGDSKMTAHCMWYDTKNNIATAQGNVLIMHADGMICLCRKATVDWTHRTGHMLGVRLFSPQRERFTAQSVHQKKSHTELTQASFTPCELCDDQLSPLWSIHAKKMVIDGEKKRVRFNQAYLSILGNPVLYTPYLSIPTQRSSGFISPDVGLTAQLGGYFSVPYFVAIAPHHDLTFSPYITTKSGTLLACQYRGRPQNNRTLIEGAFAPFGLGQYSTRWNQHPRDYPSEWGYNPPEPGTSRGYLHGKMDQNINDAWRFSGEQWWVSDKTFLETYAFLGNSDASFLPSHATLERFDMHHYFNVKTLNYRGLQLYDRQQNIPFVLPEIQYAYVSPSLWRGSTLSINGNMLSLYRAQGNRMQRAHMDGRWDWSTMTSWGQQIGAFISASTTFYALANQSPLSMDGQKNPIISTTTRYFFPQAGVISRWPWLVSRMGSISPVVQVLVSPQGVGDRNLSPPNEDSQALIFDESNFFMASRFSGYDRLDQSSRVNYGLDWSYDTSMGTATLFLGQSYALARPNPLLQSVGIRYGASDYIGQINVQWDCGNILYRFRLDSNHLRPRFQEVGWQGGPSWARISGSYAFGQRDTGLGVYSIGESKTNYNQLVIKVLSDWGNGWSVKAFATHDFSLPNLWSDKGVLLREPNPQLMDFGLGIRYGNECFSGEFTIQKSYYRIQNIQPGWTVAFSIHLTSIGGLKNEEQRFDHGIYKGWL